MEQPPLTAAIHTEFHRLCERLGHTASLHLSALRHLPGGVPNRLQAHRPWPIAIASGHGSTLIDVDGNRYRDFHNAFGTTVCGHAHPLLAEVLCEAASGPLLTGFLHPDTVELAALLAERFAVEQVLLANSGTEATQLAVRIARAATGREAIIKVEGGYHGTHDAVMVSTHPALADAGLAEAPRSVAWGAGVPEAVRALTDVIGFNDLDAAERVLSRRQHACLIVEPVMLNVGFVEPEDGYLEGLRRLCDQHGVLLIADEVKTGVTVAHGGACRRYGVEADLLCLGKGLAGGLPVGCVAGRAELLAQTTTSPAGAPHYSTFAANPLVVQAALVVLGEILTPDAYQELDERNARLVRGIEALLAAHRLPGYGVQLGAKGNVIFAPHALRDYRDYATAVDQRLRTLYWLCLMNDGILLSPGADEQWTLSVATTSEDIDAFLAAFARFCVLAAGAVAREAGA